MRRCERPPIDWSILPRPEHSPDGISNQRIEELRGIMRRHYGAELTESQARQMAYRLIALYRAILGPIPEDPGALGTAPVSASLHRMATSPKLLLLTGIPGTGKTTAGDYLADHHDFVHLDAEAHVIQGLVRTWGEFLVKARRLRDEGNNVVISWGFMPGTDDGTVRSLQKLGFTMVWFDGDRTAALREFLKRGTVTKELFDIQMAKVDSLDLDSFSSKLINPFDAKREFLSKATIAKRLLTLV